MRNELEGSLKETVAAWFDICQKVLGKTNKQIPSG
jgi:hypothetical protein